MRPFEWERLARAHFSTGRWANIVHDMSTHDLERALVVHGNSARLGHFFGHLLNDESCCVRILVVGGSSTCGGGGRQQPGVTKKELAQPRAAGAEPAGGLNGTYSAHLQRWLKHARGACCPSGHAVENLCEGGKGSEFFVDAFETSIAAVHASGTAADLVVLDTAMNDFNTFWFHRLMNASDEWTARAHLGARRDFELLVRLTLSLRPRLGVLALEPIVRHYGVPTVHVARALDDSMQRRQPLYSDPIHLSAAGHWLAAYLIVQSAGALWRTSEGAAQAWGGSPPGGEQLGAQQQQSDLLPRPLTLPSADDAAQRRAQPAQTTIDFTHASSRFRDRTQGLIREVTSGWHWAWAAKRPDGSYAEGDVDDPATPPPLEGGHAKLTFTARSARRESFVANVLFVEGTLRLGFLASYEGQAGAEVELLDSLASPPPRWVANGTWARRVSTYTAAQFEVPKEELARRRASPGVAGERAAWPARVRVTTLPRRLQPSERVGGGEREVRESRESAAIRWGAFSVCVITSY
jgi:hypothetical protein